MQNIVLFLSIFYICQGIKIKNQKGLVIDGVSFDDPTDLQEEAAEPKVDMSMFSVTEQIDKIAEKTRADEVKNAMSPYQKAMEEQKAEKA